MTTTKKPDSLVRRSPAPTPPQNVAKTAPAPSPKQQAARERFLARRPSTTPAAPVHHATARTLAPRERPQKETIGSVIGSALPTVAAGFGLGLANGSALGKSVENKFGVKVSRAIALGAGAAKLLGVDGLSPALGRSASEIMRSEMNDISRVGGETVSAMVGRLLDKSDETSKTEVSKTAPIDATPNEKAIVHEGSKANGVNGTASRDEYEPVRERTVPRNA